jgi:glycosyltransferase involved in cell wall biosynthesis
LDDQVPHLTLGAGFPRGNKILENLVKLGHAVTLYPIRWPQEAWSKVYQDIPPEVEVMLDHGLDRLREFLQSRGDYYDVIVVSRPHNMASLKSVLAENPQICGRAVIVYDAEALQSYREIERSRLEGPELSAVEQARLIKEEMSLAENCDAIMTVSDREGREFSGYGFQHVHTLGYSVEIAPTERSFEERKDFLFVGPINTPASPNADSIIWFSENALPLVQERLGEEIKLLVVGSICHGFRTRINNDSVRFLGKIEDLVPLYNEARVFIAPTRFAAGIPLKVGDAVAKGLPAVATSLVGLQLGWKNDQELLLADDPKSFAEACVRLYTNRSVWYQLRENAIKRAGEDFSPARFSEQLKRIVESVTSVD